MTQQEVRTVNSTDGPDQRCDRAQFHEIRLQGHLDPRWADSLQGMLLTLESGGITALTGPVMDQAALHGLLARIRDLGMPILSLRRVCPGPESDQKAGEA